MVMRTPTPRVFMEGPPDGWDITVEKLAALPADRTLLLDARPILDWETGTIPGARSLSVGAVTVDSCRKDAETAALIGEVLVLIEASNDD